MNRDDDDVVPVLADEAASLISAEVSLPELERSVYPSRLLVIDILLELVVSDRSGEISFPFFNSASLFSSSSSSTSSSSSSSSASSISSSATYSSSSTADSFDDSLESFCAAEISFSPITMVVVVVFVLDDVVEPTDAVDGCE